jgi:hypothetical protein
MKLFYFYKPEKRKEKCAILEFFFMWRRKGEELCSLTDGATE